MATNANLSIQMKQEGEAQFKKAVFPQEIQDIKTRRQRLNLLADSTAALRELDTSKPATPSTRFGLVGLALSGGGIRSATFNLGVVQALAKHGILKHVDYLSTVSGGGYLGACLSSLLNSKHTGTEPRSFPFRHESGKEEPVAFKHLRNSGNYIAPNGAFDLVRIPALLLRGIAINLLIVLPYIVLLVLLTMIWLPPETPGMVEGKGSGALTLGPSNWYYLTKLALGLGVLWLLAFPLLQRFFSRTHGRRNAYEQTFAISLLAIVGSFVLESLPILLQSYHHLLQTKGSVIGAWAWLFTGGSFVPYLFSGKISGKLGKLRGKVYLVALGLLGPFLLLLIYLHLGVWAIYDYPPRALTWMPFNVVYVMVLSCIVVLYTRLFVNVNTTSLHGFYRDRLSKAYLFQVDEQGRVSPNDAQALSSLNSDPSQAPYHLINVALNLQGSDDPELRGRNADFFVFSKRFTGSIRTGYCQTRDLEARDPHLNLGTAMAISGAAAAPNMGTTTIKPLVFIMTLLNIRLGYWLLNPNRLKVTGDGTNPAKKKLSTWTTWGVGPVYLVKELLSRIDARSKYVNLSDGGHIENLGVYELLRRRCKYVLVGDAEADPDMTFHGLATLQRYARIDMGIDITINLDDLRRHDNGLSQKHCAIGTIDYGDGETGYLLYVKSSVSGDERAYIQEYRAKHPDFPHETTADQFFNEAQFEAYRALGYRIVNDLFQPRRMRTEDLLAPEPVIQPSVAAWFERLTPRLLPRFHMEGDFVALQEHLSELEEQFCDADVAAYTYEIYPELKHVWRQAGPGTHVIPLSEKPAETVTPGDTDASLTAEGVRKIFHVCNMQMQLMENVFIALRLDKVTHRTHYLNRGWINLFQRWAQAPLFRRAWAVSIGTYSVSFQTFCEEVLKLESQVVWRPATDNDLTPRERHLLERQRDQRAVTPGDHTREAIWVVEMAVRIAPGDAGFTSAVDENDAGVDHFPVGFARLKFDTALQQVTLLFYRIHDYYRKMRLMDDMIPALRKRLEAPDQNMRTFRVDLSPIALERQTPVAAFFERHGFEVTGLGESPPVTASAAPSPAQPLPDSAAAKRDAETHPASRQT